MADLSRLQWYDRSIASFIEGIPSAYIRTSFLVFNLQQISD
jgi:hypothetical protein